MSEVNDQSERLRVMQTAIEKAAEITSGCVGADPLEVFPDPSTKERRADVVWGADLTEDEQEAFRGVLSEIGPGRKYNVGPKDSGLQDNGYVALFEGGQPHKMIAQLNVVAQDSEQPSVYILSGSPERVLGETEKTIGAKLLGIEADQVAGNELAMAEQIVRSQLGFEPAQNQDTETSSTESTKYDLKMIGHLEGRPVQLMAISRQYNEDGSYKQLSNTEKIQTVAKEGQPVALVTSATYAPSNEVAVAKSGVEAVVLTYGTVELAKVKGEPVSEPSIAQLGAEAFKATQLLAKNQ